MNTISPALLGFLHTVLMVAVFAVLTFLGQATNLTGVLNPATAALVALVANFLAHAMSPQGTGLFGSVKTA